MHRVHVGENPIKNRKCLRPAFDVFFFCRKRRSLCHGCLPSKKYLATCGGFGVKQDKNLQINENRIFERNLVHFSVHRISGNSGETRGISGISGNLRGNLGEISGEISGNLGESRGNSGNLGGKLGETWGNSGHTWGNFGELSGNFAGKPHARKALSRTIFSSGRFRARMGPY